MQQLCAATSDEGPRDIVNGADLVRTLAKYRDFDDHGIPAKKREQIYASSRSMFGMTRKRQTS